jgi:hypothetical protein
MIKYSDIICDTENGCPFNLFKFWFAIFVADCPVDIIFSYSASAYLD